VTKPSYSFLSAVCYTVSAIRRVVSGHVGHNVSMFSGGNDDSSPTLTASGNMSWWLS